MWGHSQWPRTRISDVVYVEARIYKLNGLFQKFQHAALLSGPCIVLPDKLLEELCRRGELQVFIHVACKVALACPPVDFRHEAFIEAKDEVPVSGVGRQCDVHLQVAVADDGIVQVHAHEIVVSRVSGTDELFGDTSASSG